MFKRLFDFFVFSSLFIAVCAVMMVWQTVELFGLPHSYALYGFVFSGAVCSYNFHWYLTPPQIPGSSKRLSWSLTNKNIHFLLFLLGLAGSAVTALLLLDHWFWLGVTAVLTFLYSAPKIPHPAFAFLKKIALGKTIFLAFAWTHVTVSLPLLMDHAVLSDAEVAFVVNRFFFLYAICILFDYRDVEDDRKAGIKSMITFLDEKGIDILFWGSLVTVLASSGLLLPQFHWLTIFLLLVPAVILSLLYHPSKRTNSDYRFYFVLDGLMMLSAPLLLLSKFAP